MVEGYDLLYQRVAKTLLTRLGSNPFHQGVWFYCYGVNRTKGESRGSILIERVGEESLR